MTQALEYSNNRPKLIIPEYGRHIQKMVNQCVAIKDQQERNNTAKAIIGVMGNLNPHLRDVPDFQHKLWDQLFIISDFKLDVDSPYEKPSKELLAERPEPLAYPQNHPKYRYYGNNIKRMIDVAISWQLDEKRKALEFAIANHMKKCYLNWNKDTVEDTVIFEHLYELSKGQIVLKDSQEELVKFPSLLNNNKKNNNNRNYKKQQKGRKKRLF